MKLQFSSDNIVLRGHCIIVPKSLQDQVIELAHQGDQGITKT